MLANAPVVSSLGGRAAVFDVRFLGYQDLGYYALMLNIAKLPNILEYSQQTNATDPIVTRPSSAPPPLSCITF